MEAGGKIQIDESTEKKIKMLLKIGQEPSSILDLVPGVTKEQIKQVQDEMNMATGGRAGYQTGGITMANTLAQNIAQNRANQQAIQNSLTDARRIADIQKQKPGLSQQAIQALLTDARKQYPGAPPMLRFESSSRPNPPSAEAKPLTKQTQDTLQDLRQQQTASGMTGDDLVPEFDDEIQLGGGVGLINPFSGASYGTGEKLEALEQGVAQGKTFDEIQEDFSNQQLNRFTDDLKFSSFADGREVDPGIGKNAYNNLLNFLKFDYPNVFSQLTGQETLAELDQIALDAGNFSKGGRAGFANGSEKNMKMAGYLDPMSEKNDMAMEMFGKQLKDLSEIELELLDEEIQRLRSKFMAKGGRVLKQTGGITESRTLPPEFIEAAQKTFLADLTRQSGIPSITTATTQQPGETAEQFAQRQAQAQQFGITRAGMAELAPQVAAQDPLQAAAYAQAVDPTKGLGAFEPFLTKATTAADAASALTGTGAGTGPGSIASYTSPFQQQVIDTTLAEFDKQKQIEQNRLAASTLGTPGAFGGGREGVQRAEFQATSGMNRSRLLADLQQKGFQNAAARRQQDLANQQAVANQQRGLGAAAQDFARAQISGLGTLGSAQQAQTQAILDAQRQASQMAVDDPRRRLSMLGAGIAQLTPGAGAVNISEATGEAAGASPLMRALGLGLAGADIYGRIFK